MSVAESLSALWQVVLQPVQSLKTKTLMSLTRPFEDATNVSGAGAGARRALVRPCRFQLGKQLD